MKQEEGKMKMRDRLILAGVEELSEYGHESFSVRRIASKCGVSCAAPYKHFESKDSFIAAIIAYINEMWSCRQVEAAGKGTTKREKIIEVCTAHIRFLVENPEFQSILISQNNTLDKKYSTFSGHMSKPTRRLVYSYCRDLHMTPDTRHQKTLVMRSLIYGSAIMFTNDEFEYNESNMAMVRATLEREFDLP